MKWKRYRKTATQEMRPYVPGEDLSAVSVSAEDTPELGGMIYLRYLRYVVRHKWCVMVACFRHGLLWRGIVHDWHKLRPCEFVPYAKHFGGRISTGRNATGYYKPTNTGDAAFDLAWFRHIKLGQHHWQYWCIPEHDGCVALEMPRSCAIEMVCDWIGAGRAQGTPDTIAWYNANRDRLVLHPETRRLVEHLIYHGATR